MLALAVHLHLVPFSILRGLCTTIHLGEMWDWTWRWTVILWRFERNLGSICIIYLFFVSLFSFTLRLHWWMWRLCSMFSISNNKKLAIRLQPRSFMSNRLYESQNMVTYPLKLKTLWKILRKSACCFRSLFKFCLQNRRGHGPIGHHLWAEVPNP